MIRSAAAMDERRKVAIIGGASSRRRAPYSDHSWEVWAFSSLRLRTPRVTRWFEMHALGDLRDQLRRSTRRRWSYRRYMAFLQALDVPVYMQRTHASIPNSVAYPLEQALSEFGRCYTSTVSYLIALAMIEQFESIGVWGVHLTERHIYRRQRPGVEYLLGVAKQRGHRIVLPTGCPLRVPKRPSLPETPILYGYDWQSPKAWWRRRSRRRAGR